MGRVGAEFGTSRGDRAGRGAGEARLRGNADSKQLPPEEPTRACKGAGGEQRQGVVLLRSRMKKQREQQALHLTAIKTDDFSLPN